MRQLIARDEMGIDRQLATWCFREKIASKVFLVGALQELEKFMAQLEFLAIDSNNFIAFKPDECFL